MINPTGGYIRNDDQGHGYFHSPRGSRLHNGVDFTLPGGVGQLVLSPITGTVKRYAYPYADDKSLAGVLIEGADIGIKMFYLSPIVKVGQKVSMGEPVGVAQDLSLRYPGMTPHIHLEVTYINPLLIMGL